MLIEKTRHRDDDSVTEMKWMNNEKWRGASQLGEHNGCELNQQSTLMLMLLCLFKLIIKDRAPSSPCQKSREFVSAMPCQGN